MTARAGVRHGFSLVEVLISISLALVIIGTVYAGFQMATQSITTAERLALENRLMTAGLYIAIDEADSWRALDRPGREPLRTTPSKTIDVWSGGYTADGSDWQQLPQPFTPLADSWPLSGAALPFEPDRWAPHNPATWFRGDGGYYPGRDHSGKGMGGFAAHTDESGYGNYAIFENAATRVREQSSGGATVNLDAIQRWLPNQHKGLKYALGFYGWMDYLPANAMVHYYDVHNGRGTMPIELRERQHGVAGNFRDIRSLGRHGTLATQLSTNGGSLAGYLSHAHTGSERAVTRGMQWSNPFGISSTEPWINRVQVPGVDGPGVEYVFLRATLIADLAAAEPVIATHPEHWPEISVDVRRFMDWGAINTYCYIRLVDPVTGLSRQVFFPTLGSTLRGARLSRGLDAP